MKILTGNSNKYLSEKISRHLKTKLVNNSIKKFTAWRRKAVRRCIIFFGLNTYAFNENYFIL